MKHSIDDIINIQAAILIVTFSSDVSLQHDVLINANMNRYCHVSRDKPENYYGPLEVVVAVVLLLPMQAVTTW